MKEIPEELLPVIEWWEKDGKQTLVMLAVAAIVVGGFYGYKNWRQTQRTAAADAAMTAYSAEDLETAAQNYGSQKAGPAIKQRLAKKYFDDGKYREALDLYTALEGHAAEGFEEVPAIGAAQCLEALGKCDEALAKFTKFAEENADSCFALTAKLGAARCLCQLDKREEAVKALEALKAEMKGDATAVARIEGTLDAVKRWVKRELASPVDATAALEKTLENVAAAPAAAAVETPVAAESAGAAEAK